MMTRNTVDTMVGMLREQKEILEKEMWEIHDLLNGPYNNKLQALKDAQRLGAVADIIEAFNNLQSKLLDYRSKCVE